MARVLGCRATGLLDVRMEVETGEVRSRLAFRGWARRATLTASLVFTVGVPLWHVAHNQASTSGVPIATSAGRALARLEVEWPAPSALGAPWSLALGSLEIMDPLAGLSLLATGRSFPLLALLPALVLTALFGRFFCGWLCPYVPLLAASLALRRISTSWHVRPRDVRLPPRLAYGVLVGLVIGGAIAGTHLVPVLYPPAAIGRELFRLITYGSAGAGLAVIGLAFVFDAFVSRAGFCRSICPGGALLRAIGSLSPVTVRRDEARCTSCGDCVVVCNLGQSPMTDRIDGGCERCGACIESCAPMALRFGVRRLPVVGAHRGQHGR